MAKQYGATGNADAVFTAYALVKSGEQGPGDSGARIHASADQTGAGDYRRLKESGLAGSSETSC